MIAVDASLALKLVLDEPGSTAAREQWQRWTDSREVLIAPVLFCAETFSGLRRSVYSGRLSQEDGDRAYTILDNLTVELREPNQLYGTAWQFAQRFQRPTVYDCCYLALAAITQCEFWTADRRLANAVGNQLQWLHLLET